MEEKKPWIYSDYGIIVGNKLGLEDLNRAVLKAIEDKDQPIKFTLQDEEKNEYEVEVLQTEHDSYFSREEATNKVGSVFLSLLFLIWFLILPVIGVGTLIYLTSGGDDDSPVLLGDRDSYIKPPMRRLDDGAIREYLENAWAENEK